MGHYVHIHVCFACDRNEGVAALAKKCLAPMSDENSIREVRWFLSDLANRTGFNHGPKGGLSMWGIVGNYTDGPRFVEQLRPFWTELLAEVEDGPFAFEHVLVFVEHEQSEQATAYEISYNEDMNELTVKEHACPFAWMQM